MQQEETKQLNHHSSTKDAQTETKEVLKCVYSAVKKVAVVKLCVLTWRA